MSSKENIAKQVINALPRDAKVSKIAYFPKKIVFIGQSHISRKNQLLKITRKLSTQFKRDIVLRFKRGCSDDG